MTEARLIVICGLPGSGKTTLAKKLERELEAIRFCPDEWLLALDIDLYDEAKRARIEALQWEIGQSLLAKGQRVIIEWGVWARSERDTLRLGAKAIGAAVELHYLAVPFEELFKRVQERGMESPVITRDDLLGWFQSFQEPSPEELDLYDAPLLSESDLA